jgi:hypothetical protein
MPTELRRPVTRRCVEPYDHRRKRLVVALEPGDVISFREERSRKTFSAPLARVFRQVVTWNVEAERARKKGAQTCARKS